MQEYYIVCFLYWILSLGGRHHKIFTVKMTRLQAIERQIIDEKSFPPREGAVFLILHKFIYIQCMYYIA